MSPCKDPSMDLVLSDLRSMTKRRRGKEQQRNSLLKSAIQAVRLNQPKDAIERLRLFRVIAGISVEDQALIDCSITTLSSVSSLSKSILRIHRTPALVLSWFLRGVVWWLMNVGYFPFYNFKKMRKICCQSFIENRCRMSRSEFADLTSSAPKNYHTKSIPKENGRHRVLKIPAPILKKHQTALKNELNKFPLVSGICGGPGSSTPTAMQPHTGNRPMVITLDIADFFPSIRVQHMRSLFGHILDEPLFVDQFVRLVSHKGCLPQGAPTSPAIARLIIQPIFIEVEKAIKSIDPSAKLTLWIDDLTISGYKGLRRMTAVIKKVFERNGFTIREEKTRFMERGFPQENLGLEICGRSLRPCEHSRNKYKFSLSRFGRSNKKIRGYQSYCSHIKTVNKRHQGAEALLAT